MADITKREVELTNSDAAAGALNKLEFDFMELAYVKAEILYKLHHFNFENK